LYYNALTAALAAKVGVADKPEFDFPSARPILLRFVLRVRECLPVQATESPSMTMSYPLSFKSSIELRLSGDRPKFLRKPSKEAPFSMFARRFLVNPP
jgi:hypothetical protein